MICTLILGFTLAAIPTGAFGQETTVVTSQGPNKEASLSRKEVEDALFAYILGIIMAGTEIDLDRMQMAEILDEFHSTLNIPIDLIDRVTQNTDENAVEPTIRMQFTRDVSVPIPFALLFYHPGKILSSQHLVWETHRYWFFVPENGSGPVQAIDLVLRQGSVEVILDEWLKVLFSAHCEDTWIHHIIIFRWKGHVLGLLAGVGQRTGRVLRAYFDFTKNSIIFPAPASLNRVGEILYDTPE
jgi:hypothetical protein